MGVFFWARYSYTLKGTERSGGMLVSVIKIGFTTAARWKDEYLEEKGYLRKKKGTSADAEISAARVRPNTGVPHLLENAPP